MSKSRRKEKSAITVTLFACAAFVIAAVFVYGVPKETIFSYIGFTLALLLTLMVIAILIVALRTLLRKLFRPRD